LFYAETLYGDFSHPILRKLQSINRSPTNPFPVLLVKNLMDAEKLSIGSPEASQQAYEIANILKADTVYGPLHHLLENHRRLAEYLGEMGSHDPSRPNTLQRLWDKLSFNQADVDSLVYYANWKGRQKASLRMLTLRSLYPLFWFTVGTWIAWKMAMQASSKVLLVVSL
jgi:hypothetical protein